MTNMNQLFGQPFGEAQQPPIAGKLTQATLGDVREITRLMQEAADFKWQRGDDLWGTTPFSEEEVGRMIQSGNTFVYRLDGFAAASVMLPLSDTGMWGEERGNDGSAVYIHKLCVGETFRGGGVGRQVMSMAESFAQQHGKTKLRLDCPYDNPDLCGYYERLGFREVGRKDLQNSNGRNPDKEIYKAAFYEKELVSSI
jgi:ribosomal protein S18 acetylase RimI-like enzyme